jgi:chitinase
MKHRTLASTWFALGVTSILGGALLQGCSSTQPSEALASGDEALRGRSSPCAADAGPPKPAKPPEPAPATDPSAGSSDGTSPLPASAFEAVLSRSTFEAMFPSRNAFYTYEGLSEAAQTFPAFAAGGTADDKKREVAAFLANVSHETGGLVYIEEIDKADYCSDGAPDCPCAPGKSYFGRGPLQLSWNYNYCAASQAIFGDAEVLRLDPDRVAQDPKIAWATALYFWMTSTGAGKATAHDAMTGAGDFGATIRTINGAVECDGKSPDTVADRVRIYTSFCALLSVDTGPDVTC